MNVFIGSRSGENAQTHRTVNVGSCSGTYNVTGSDSVHIGTCSGENCKRSDRNVFIGANAGKDVVDGADNVVVGLSRAFTKGNNNLVLGNVAETHDLLNNTLLISDYVRGTDTLLELRRNVAVNGTLTCDNASATEVVAVSVFAEDVVTGKLTSEVVNTDKAVCDDLESVDARIDNVRAKSVTVDDGVFQNLRGESIVAETVVPKFTLNDLNLTLAWFLANTDPNGEGRSLVTRHENRFVNLCVFNKSVYDAYTSTVLARYKTSYFLAVQETPVLYLQRDVSVLAMRDLILDRDSNDYTLTVSVGNDRLVGYHDFDTVGYFDLSDYRRSVMYEASLRAHNYDGSVRYLRGARNVDMPVLNFQFFLMI